ncbi:MAG: SPASM domain-containing protein, partial [Desulfosudaceae bacterium]
GGCDAGWTGVSVTPGGDIYPCQISVSRKDWRLGNVHDGLEADGREKWEQFAARVSPLCDSCWARPYCPGPCPYALPIPEQWSFCRTMKHQVREVLKFCGTVSSTDLLRTSLPPLTDSSLATALQRYLALRDILWTENKLIKPLAIGPWNREKR